MRANGRATSPSHDGRTLFMVVGHRRPRDGKIRTKKPSRKVSDEPFDSAQGKRLRTRGSRLSSL